MRKVRVYFSGLRHFAQFLDILERLHEMGEAQCAHINYTTGYGTFVLLTKHSHRKLEDSLALGNEAVLTGVEDLNEEGCHDCHTMVA